MILVRFEDGSFRKVPSALLGRLIKLKKITHFRRLSGWVDIARDAVREHCSPGYRGRERRERCREREEFAKKRNCSVCW
jgi:hypothetical protein